MKLKGKRIEYNVGIEISKSEIIDRLIIELGFGDNFFIKDNSIYRWEDVGHHNTEFKNFLVTNDIDKVELLKSLLIVKKYINSK